MNIKRMFEDPFSEKPRLDGGRQVGEYGLNLMQGEIRLAGCVVESEGKVLLIHRNKNGKIRWEIPGGKVEKGESDEEAAKREVKEELGVEVKLEGCLGEGSFDEGAERYCYVWFTARISDFKVIKLEQGFDQYKLFKVTELGEGKIELSAGTKKLLSLFGSDLVREG